MVPLLPWEKMLLRAAPQESLTTTIEVPASVLEDIKLVRRSVLKNSGNGPYDFSHCRSVLRAQAKTLLEMERTFTLEINYLNIVLHANLVPHRRGRFAARFRLRATPPRNVRRAELTSRRFAEERSGASPAGEDPLLRELLRAPR